MFLFLTLYFKLHIAESATEPLLLLPSHDLTLFFPSITGAVAFSSIWIVFVDQTEIRLEI
jgi:hypothetical protein